MKLPMYQVDAFSARLFAGNPAAVVLVETELPVQTMQAIAAENNLADTAFVRVENGCYTIRWFTPTMEVDLCGHATLAAAHVLFERGSVSGDEIVFSSKSGKLSVCCDDGLLTLDFPADDFTLVASPPTLTEGLAVEPVEVYRGRDDYLVILENENQVRTLQPDLLLISQLPSRGVIVSSEGKDIDFVCRFFAPQLGIPEDSVTGSAYTTLTPYWSRKLKKEVLNARQLSSRGGELICSMRGNRVGIGGRAVTFFSGEIFL